MYSKAIVQQSKDGKELQPPIINTTFRVIPPENESLPSLSPELMFDNSFSSPFGLAQPMASPSPVTYNGSDPHSEGSDLSGCFNASSVISPWDPRFLESEHSVYTGTFSENYQNFTRSVSPVVIPLKECKVLGNISDDPNYYFDDTAAIPAAQQFIAAFWSDKNNLELTVNQQISRYHEILEKDRAKMNALEEIISNNTLKLVVSEMTLLSNINNLVKHTTPQKTFSKILLNAIKVMKDTVEKLSPVMEIDSYIEIIDDLTTLEQQGKKVNFSNLNGIPKRNLKDEVNAIKGEINNLYYKIEKQWHVYNTKIENSQKEGCPPLCVSFIIAEIHEKNYCYLSISSSNLNKLVYDAIKAYTKEYNANIPALTYELLTPYSDNNFDKLISNINKKLNLNAPREEQRKCAEKTFANAMTKLYHEHDEAFKVISVCNVQFYPYELTKSYGNSAEALPHKAIKALDLNKGKLIKVNNNFSVPTIPCCANCVSNKQALLNVWVAAREQGINERVEAEQLQQLVKVSKEMENVAVASSANPIVSQNQLSTTESCSNSSGLFLRRHSKSSIISPQRSPLNNSEIADAIAIADRSNSSARRILFKN